jgi:two-component system sensor histidine kinase KdpD
MHPGDMRRGRLRIYLGTTAGAGTTTAMLQEGHRRAASGADVAVAAIDTHQRPELHGLLDGLELLTDDAAELELAVLLRRRPDVALIDEPARLARSVDPTRGPWAAVDAVLDAGIDVVATVSIGQVASARDVVSAITGIDPVGSLPDPWVRAADEIELVDVAPEELRRRLVEGELYGRSSLGAQQARSLQVEQLAAQRELALRWMADSADAAQRDRRREESGRRDRAGWDTNERVMVAVTAAPGSDAVIRRASRLAQRSNGRLIGVHVVPSGDALRAAEVLTARRRLVEDLGGLYVEAHGAEVAETLVRVARSERATQIVLGATRRGRWASLLGGSVVQRVLRLAPECDVHVIATDSGIDELQGALSVGAPTRRSPLSPRRIGWSWLLLAAGLLVLNVSLLAVGDAVTLPVALMANLLLTVGVAALGGLAPGVVGAVAAFLTVNYFFVRPTHTFKVADTMDVVALGTFLVVALVVASLVDRVARRTAEVDRAAAASTSLARSTAELLGDADPLPGLVQRIRTTFDFESVSLLRRSPEGWVLQTSSGERPATRPGGGWVLPLWEDGSALVVVRGGEPSQADRTVLRAFTDQLALAVGRVELMELAARAEVLAEADALRQGLLLAVSHDLRTPLAGIKASVTSLLADDVTFDRHDTDAFLRAIDHEVDRLDRVIGNLLDAGRLQGGDLPVSLQACGLDEIVWTAVQGLSSSGDRVATTVDPQLPAVLVDGPLLERAVANVVANAMVVQPGDIPVWVDAEQVDDVVVLSVVDRGPGIPVSHRQQVFEPFQRLGDRSSQAGVGLGLAIARGFTEAMGGELDLDDTPGGGLTVRLRLPVAGEDAAIGRQPAGER